MERRHVMRAAAAATPGQERAYQRSSWGGPRDCNAAGSGLDVEQGLQQPAFP